MIQSRNRSITNLTILTLTILSLAVVTACSGSVSPAQLDSQNDACATCRMVVSRAATASQIAAPNQEAKFFDDLGCLEQFLAANPLGRDARVFVADHRTAEWVPVEAAVFTKLSGAAGAMGSPFVAHASAASRDADPAAAGMNVAAATVLPSLHLPGGTR